MIIRHHVILWLMAGLGASGGNAYGVAYWTDAGPDHLWDQPANWSASSSHRPPADSDSTYIRFNDLVPTGQGPLIQDGIDAVCRNLSFESQSTGQTLTMTMTGGSLTIYYPGATNCYFRLPAGTGPGAAVFNMSGGTLTIDQDDGNSGLLRIGSGYAGRMNMSGDALVNALALELHATADTWIDLRDSAKIILDGDETDTIETYIATGLITAYGHPEYVDYHYYSSTDKTRISAVPPGKAFDPVPYDTAIAQSPDVALTWSPAPTAASHDVYFGDTFYAVDAADTGSPEFVGNKQTTSVARETYHPAGPLESGKLYYWRIDEVGSTVTRGDVWSFSTEGFIGPACPVPNPVIFEMKDCGVLKHNGEYYLIGTGSDGDMYPSENLLNWGPRTHVFSMNNAWATGEAGDDDEIHACDLQYLDGVFHLYWSINRPEMRHIGHAVTTGHPLNSYTEPVTSTWFADRIDAHLFRDDDGADYFYTVKFPAGNVVYGQTMADPWTLTGVDNLLISTLSGTWERQSVETINEAEWVAKYRDRYYMLYNANHTAAPFYSVGCVESDGPLAFKNADKYPDPVLAAASRGGHTITNTGQPTLLRGPNGFEWWVVYFARYDGSSKSIAVDRVLFFDRRLFIAGPSSNLPAFTGGTFTPPPAAPTFDDLFNEGAALDDHWTVLSGAWDVADAQARQTDPDAPHCHALADSLPASHYLVETGLRFLDDAPSAQQAGLTVYYQDPGNTMTVTLDPADAAWSYTRLDDGAPTSASFPLPPAFDYAVYHTLRVTRNDARFDVFLDGRPAPGNPVILTDYHAPSLTGLYTHLAPAAFDGFCYTVGWDEYDDAITGWDDASGTWTVTSAGLHATDPAATSTSFKGDLLDRYEFMAQLTPTAAVPQDADPHAMGLYAAYTDPDNYLLASIDLVNHRLQLTGRLNAADLPLSPISLAPADTYNLRVIKHADAFRLFVDGELKITLPVTDWPASQVGLYTQNIPATFNGITLFKLGSQYGPTPPANDPLTDNFDDNLFSSHWQQLAIHKDDPAKHDHSTLPDIVINETDRRLRFSGCEQGDDTSPWYGRGLQYRTPILGNSICDFDFDSLQAYSDTSSVARAAIGLRIIKDPDNWLEIRQTDDVDGDRLETTCYNQGVKTTTSQPLSATAGHLKIRFDNASNLAECFLDDALKAAATLPALHDAQYSYAITAYTSNTDNRILCNVDNFRIHTSRADLNDDWTVNLKDFALFLAQWEQTNCSPDNIHCLRCDFNHDTRVDTKDLANLTASWLLRTD